MIYGFYYCLNIVTETKDYPSAVLIRALEPLEGIEKMKENRKTDNISNLTSGPGKLCQALEITKNIDGTSAISKNSKLYIEDRRIEIPANQIVKAKRIGVDYAGIWKDKLLDFTSTTIRLFQGNDILTKILFTPSYSVSRLNLLRP